MGLKSRKWGGGFTSSRVPKREKLLGTDPRGKNVKRKKYINLYELSSRFVSNKFCFAMFR
jgi:hypothetical protein